MRAPPTGPRPFARRRLGLVLVMCLIGWSAHVAHARSLVEGLRSLVSTAGVTILDRDLSRTRVVDVVTPVTERLAVRGIDFPVASTTPGFTYRFNFELGTPERLTLLGSNLEERADTVGRRRLDLGVFFVRGDLDKVDGEDFGTTVAGRVRVPIVLGQQFFLDERVHVDSFHLLQTVVDMTATYGLTDRWDLNALVPIVLTEVDARTSVRFKLLDDRSEELLDHVHTTRQLHEEKHGPGDVLLRSKYRTWEGDHLWLALGTTLRLPTGNEDNLQGVGDVIVTPSMILSRPLGAQDLHANLGFDANADDAVRSRVRYTIGASWQPVEFAALLADVLGSSGIAADRFDVPSRIKLSLRRDPRLRRDTRIALGEEPVRPTRSGTIPIALTRSDVLDLSVGIKVAVARTSAFAGVVLPLTNDGLRADLLPTAGFQVTF